MKKILVLSFILAILVIPSFSRAQVIPQVNMVDLTPEARATLIAELNMKLVELLNQLVLALTTQMKDQATNTNTQISTLGSKIDTVVANTAPKVSAVDVAPTVNLGYAFCMGTGHGQNLVISGDNWDFGVARILGITGGTQFSKGNTKVWGGVDDGTYNYEIKLYRLKDSKVADPNTSTLVATSQGSVTYNSCTASSTNSN